MSTKLAPVEAQPGRGLLAANQKLLIEAHRNIVFAAHSLSKDGANGELRNRLFAEAVMLWKRIWTQPEAI